MDDHTTHDAPQEIPYGYCQCGCGNPTWIATVNSEKYGWVKGQHLPFYRNHGARLPIEHSFWAKVDKRGPDECWEWQGYRDKAGYGELRHKGRNARAPRVSWEIHFGKPPAHLVVCHKCDNPSCINPNHLFLGTHADNVKDKIRKGRQPRGKDHGIAKLTEEQVAGIRRAYAHGDATRKELATKYSLHVRTVGNIVNRVTWKHIP